MPAVALETLEDWREAVLGWLWLWLWLWRAEVEAAVDDVDGIADEVAKVVLAPVVTVPTVVLTTMDCVAVCTMPEDVKVEHEVA